MPVAAAPARAWRSIPADRSTADRTGALCGQPPRAHRRTDANLENPAAGHLAEQMRVGLAQCLRTPDEIGYAQEPAVLGVVVVGVAVPPATVRTRRRRGIGGSSADATLGRKVCIIRR